MTLFLIIYPHQALDFSHLSPSARRKWRLIDIYCSAVCEVLGILGWFGIYRILVDNLPEHDVLLIALGFGIIIVAQIKQVFYPQNFPSTDLIFPP